jgi:tetratricopeptide (TPR) repeat protein
MEDDGEITVVRALGVPATARPRGPAILTVLSGHELGRTHRLVASETIIGRGSDVDLLIDDDGVSRRHAKVIREIDGTLKIQDMGSTNGTYLNGERIELEALREGDRVRIGQAATLEVRYEHRDTREDPQIPPVARSWPDNLATTSDSLGRVQVLGEDYDRALKSHRRTLVLRQESLGTDHPSVASILADIGQVLRAKGEHAQALEQHERALEIYEERVGSGIAPPEMAHLLTNIGQCHLDLGESEKALGVLERSLEMLWERRASDRELAPVRFAVARALHALSRQPVRMRSLAKMARDALASSPEGGAVAREIDCWLDEIDAREP